MGEKPSPGTAHFLVGEETRRLLQKMFEVPSEDRRDVGCGRDVDGRIPKGYYDYLKVERAWRIKPSCEIVDQYADFVEDLMADCPYEPTKLREAFAMAVLELEKAKTADHAGKIDPLQHVAANEVLLLHGTKPDVVAQILEQSLDPGLAQAGMFGNGTYFAEHPAKIDQYVTRDMKWIKGGAFRSLHKKLYPDSSFHPGNVYYALVCRVALGTPDVTVQRRRGRPPSGEHSLVVELGESIFRFREFVVFDKRAIKIEYLVAYTRVKAYCACGDEVKIRTYFDKHQEDVRRPCISCPNSRKDPMTGEWQGGCRLWSGLPRCHCPNQSSGDFFTATADTAGREFVCSKGLCGFRQWMPSEAIDDDEVSENLDEYEKNSFLASDSEPSLSLSDEDSADDKP
jgi:hypothetical protein